MGNAAQAALLLLAMAGLFALLGWTVAGALGLLWFGAVAAALSLAGPRVSPHLLMRLYHARPLDEYEAPGLHRLVYELAVRAGLPAVPRIYYLPSDMVNAFAAGEPGSAVIAVTHGLLDTLSPRQLAGVVAHELSHVRAGDMRVMGLADLFSRLTHSLSTLGQLLVLLNLPLLIMGGHGISWLTLLVLVLSPSVSALLQLALSRSREYHADVGAVALTGDPEGLAAALLRIERVQGGFVERLLLPGRRVPEPSLLRTHPPTDERVRRLRALHAASVRAAAAAPGQGFQPPPAGPRHQPRWHVSGLWF